MLKIVSIMLKNFKLIFRSYLSILILIVSPLLILYIVGFFHNNTSNLNPQVGWYSEQPSDLSESLALHLKSKNFTVRQFTQSLNDCIEEVKKGAILICIEFPPNMRIEEDKINEVVFHVHSQNRDLSNPIIKEIDGDFRAISYKLSTYLSNEWELSISSSQDEVMGDIPLLNKVIADTKELSENIGEIHGKIKNSTPSFDPDRMDMTGPLNRARYIIMSVTSVEEEAMNCYNALEDCGEDSDELRVKFQKAINQTIINSNLMEPELNKIEDQIDYVAAELISNKDRNEEINRLQTVKERLDQSRSSLIKALDSLGIVSSVDQSSPYISKTNEIVSEKNPFHLIPLYFIIMIIVFIIMLLSSTAIVMKNSNDADIKEEMK